jgi:hypothetical protein
MEGLLQGGKPFGTRKRIWHFFTITASGNLFIHDEYTIEMGLKA